MKINPDLIPHSEFHKGLWLQTSYSPWYFFYKTPRSYTIPKDNKFYKTVDDDLLEIVKLFHSKGIPTTPSCSGHILPIKQYSDLFDTILVVKNKIKNGGVILKNPETNRRFFYENKKYSLPWNKDAFLSEMDDYQKKGVIGFIDELGLYDKLKNKMLIKKDGDITMIFTKGETKNEIKQNWNKIFKILNRYI